MIGIIDDYCLFWCHSLIIRLHLLGKAFEKGCLSFVSSLRERVEAPRKKHTFLYIFMFIFS